MNYLEEFKKMAKESPIERERYDHASGCVVATIGILKIEQEKITTGDSRYVDFHVKYYRFSMNRQGHYTGKSFHDNYLNLSKLKPGQIVAVTVKRNSLGFAEWTKVQILGDLNE